MGLNQERQKILDWLSPFNFASKQIDILNRRQERTGNWFLNADEFKQWISGTSRMLWCPGIRRISNYPCLGQC